VQSQEHAVPATRSRPQAGTHGPRAPAPPLTSRASTTPRSLRQAAWCTRRAPAGERSARSTAAAAVCAWHRAVRPDALQTADQRVGAADRSRRPGAGARRAADHPRRARLRGGSARSPAATCVTLIGLGVALAEWAQAEASVSCFAHPEAHARHDRDASCSVNVEPGLWNCHGCGEGGGAYDAATARGRTPREAMDLLVSCGSPRGPGCSPAATSRW
jgi:hypothetical protein